MAVASAAVVVAAAEVRFDAFREVLSRPLTHPETV